jgi:23S rRNA (uridine2552-2'-O)-methyltransferase
MARYEPRDKFYQRARERGLPSRAAFKIDELIGRFRLVPRGARVVDLGCAPGGWLAILAAAAGAEGRVVGVDLVPCPRVAANVITLTGDIREAGVRAALRAALEGEANLITSDLAPKLTGITVRDQAAMDPLLEAALMVARELLTPGGAMIAKLFMGEGFEAARARFAPEFGLAQVVRTRASRPGSSELYLVARNFRGSRPASSSAGSENSG